MSERDHDKLTADLSAYLDGELSPARAAEIERELAASPEARQTLGALREVSQQLAALPRMRAPEGLAAEMARHAERQLLPSDAEVLRRTRTLRVLRGVAAAAAVLAAGVFVGWEMGYRSTGPQIGASPALVTDHEPPAGAFGNKREEVGELKTIERMAQVELAAKLTDSAPSAPQFANTFKEEKEAADTKVGVPGDSLGTVAQDRVYALATTGQVDGTVTRYVQPQAPAVSIVIAPQNEQEYSAAATVLAGWQQGQAVRRGTDAERSVTLPYSRVDGARVQAGSGFFQGKQATAGQSATVFVFEAPTAQLYERIDALSQSVGDPALVQCQISSTAAQMPALGLAWARYAQKAEGLEVEGELASASAGPAGSAHVDALAMTANSELERAGRSRSAGVTAAAAPERPPSPPAEGAAGGREAESQRVAGKPADGRGPAPASQPAGAPASPVAKGGAGSAAPSTAPAREKDDKTAVAGSLQKAAPAGPRNAQRRPPNPGVGGPLVGPPKAGAERRAHRAPPGTVLELDQAGDEGRQQPASRPATSQPPYGPGKQAGGDWTLAAPAPEPNGAAPAQPSPVELLGRFLRYLLQGNEAGQPGAASAIRGEAALSPRSDEPADQPAGPPVTFHVTLLPPPTAPVAGTAAPATQPATRADRQ